jgi:multicomponent Na+:H+ antiporter subunit C
MTLLLAICVGLLVATGLYLLMQRSMLRLVLGLIMLGHGANLAVFVSGGLTRATPPLVATGTQAPPADAADPLPQALVLTAIVISFAVAAFAAALAVRAQQAAVDDPDQMTSTDR